jgi:hypothetical protein
MMNQQWKRIDDKEGAAFTAPLNFQKRSFSAGSTESTIQRTRFLLVQAEEL